MQAQERELIGGLFGRLQPFESQPRDPEAEALIKDLMSRQPAAAYLLVQAVLVQEHALKAAQDRIAELEAQAKETPPPAAPSFLGSAPRLGPWGAAAAAPPRTSVPTTVPGPAATPPALAPQNRSPLQAALSPQAGGGGGGGFLRTAMMTAAGVAGGALLFEGIRGLLGGSSNPFSSQAQAAQPSPLLPPDSMPQQQQAWSDATSADNQYQTVDNQSQADDQYQQDQQFDDDYDTASLDDGGSDDNWT